MSSITTCLWFDGNAEEAAEYYVRVFTEAGRSARIGKKGYYGEASANASGQPTRSLMTVQFELDGNAFLGLNGGPHYKLTPAISFMVSCKTQQEIDYFWEKLGDGGQPSRCGWIESDRFGVAWQVIPNDLGELIAGPDPAKSNRVMSALMTMTKLDIEALRRA